MTAGPDLVPFSVLPEVADLVSVPGQSMSTAELDAAVESLSREITGAGAAAVLATPSLGTIVAVLAGIRAGVAIVPIPSDAGPVERRHILGDSAVTLLIVPAGGGAPASQAGGTRAGGSIAAVTDVSSSRDPRTTPLGAPGADPHDEVIVMYTSGTTGPPKGVPMTAAAIAADLDALVEAWDWSPDDVLVHGLPLCHVHGLILGILGPLRARSRLLHTGRPTPQSYADAARHGGTLFFGVPTVWARVASDEAAAKALRGVRLMVSGSAGLPPPVSQALLDSCGQRPVERYGMTETLITLAQRAGDEPRPGWVGRPVAGTETRVCGDDGDELPRDGKSVGTLEVRGPTVMRAYLHGTRDDEVVFSRDGWFRTGDAVVVDAGDDHRIIGRMASDLIKSGGHRIGAGEVEAALLSHSAVREAAVVGVPDEDLGQMVVAYVVADGVSGEQLVDFVAHQLSAHKRPRRINFVAELPRNTMGKLKKDLLA